MVFEHIVIFDMPSVLWRCWLGGRKSIRPVKNWAVGCWRSYLERTKLSVVICLERGADLHMAQLMPLPLTISSFSKIQIGFIFLVPTHPGSPGQRVVKRVCVQPALVIGWNNHCKFYLVIVPLNLISIFWGQEGIPFHSVPVICRKTPFPHLKKLYNCFCMFCD